MGKKDKAEELEQKRACREAKKEDAKKDLEAWIKAGGKNDDTKIQV